MNRAQALGIAVALLLAPEARAEPIRVTSPNGRVSIALDMVDSKPQWSMSVDGRSVVANSALDLQLDIAKLGSPSTLLDHHEASVDGSWRPVVGKASLVADRYNQSTVAFETLDGGFRYGVVLRAYDDGAAFRYTVPEQKDIKQFKVLNEATRFVFPADYDCWGANMGSFTTSFEGEYDPIKASRIRDVNAYIAPLVCKTGVGEQTFAIAEADVENYPGVYLAGRSEGGLGVRTRLPPRFDDKRDYRMGVSTLAKIDMDGHGFQTPWRVVMLGDRSGDLAASNLIPTLAAPSRIADTRWIKPGKTAWDWWNGWAADVPQPGANTATYKAFIDFAASMKLDGFMIDEGWADRGQITRGKASVDMPAVVAHAKAKGVGLWVWVHWMDLDAQLEEAMATYEAWGLKGIKVDFMNRNDQEMVAYYHRVLEAAARHHLMVNLHGAYPPNGLARTWPNFVTQEGVLGAELNKVSTRITASHNVTLPFTRMILGPMDYTPGGFRSISAADFETQRRSRAPFVKTSRGQAVAMYVVYDSPLQMVSDAPGAYRTESGGWADGAEFIQAVPTSWDETRFVSGDIGQYVVMARRKGDQWYLGAMTNETPRDLSVSLAFLGPGAFAASVLEDGVDMNHLKASTRAVDAKAKLNLTLAGSGGAVAVLTPVKPPRSTRGGKSERVAP